MPDGSLQNIVGHRLITIIKKTKLAYMCPELAYFDCHTGQITMIMNSPVQNRPFGNPRHDWVDTARKADHELGIDPYWKRGWGKTICKWNKGAWKLIILRISAAMSEASWKGKTRLGHWKRKMEIVCKRKAEVWMTRKFLQYSIDILSSVFTLEDLGNIRKP